MSKPKPKRFWYIARVRAKWVGGYHYVFYSTTRPKVGSQCPGVGAPNLIEGYRREKIPDFLLRTALLCACAFCLGSSLPEHGGQTLMRLARHKPVLVKPSLMPPVSTRAVSTNRPPPAPQNYVVKFPPTETNVTYNIWRSTNLVTWTLFRTNAVGPNSTSGDIYTTNDFRTSEYFRAVRVPDTTKAIGPTIPGLRWDLDPSVKTIK